MKKSIFILFIAFAYISLVDAQTAIVLPSGQRLYFEFVNSPSYPPADGYAIISAPHINSNGVCDWNGYAKPGGDIVIPDTIIYNGQSFVVIEVRLGAFQGCNAITSIVLPNTINTIYGEVFYDCSSLRTLTIGRGLEKMANPSGYGYWQATSIIRNCTSLDTIYYNADSCYMGHLFDGAIGQNTALVIGDNVKFIAPGMFQKQNINTMPTSITSVVVGSSVAEIGTNAFYNCSEITSICFRSQNPPLLGAYVFGGVDTYSVLCNIPCGRTSAYFNLWGTLFNYTEAATNYLLSVSSNNESWGFAEIIHQATCGENAIIVANASCGYYFVRWNDGNSDNPRTVSLQNDTYYTAIFASSYNVPDTVYVHDTIIVNNYIQDTTYLPVYIQEYDTVQMIEYIHDTTFLPLYVHDTIITNIYLRDTIYLPQYIHDTTYVDVPYPVHDTTYVDVHDTTYVPYPVHDTLVITDTLWMVDTIFVYDTIVIHDTITVGVDAVEYINAKIYANHGQIVVEGADGNTVTLYDVSGRQLATKRDDYMPLRLDVPAAGTYMVKIGDYPARRVVVIK